MDEWGSSNELRKSALGKTAVTGRIDYLYTLPENWDGYGASRIHLEYGEAMINYLDKVMSDNTPIPQIVPFSDGGVQAEWHVNGIDLEIEIGPEGFGALFTDFWAKGALEWDYKEIVSLKGYVDMLTRKL